MVNAYLLDGLCLFPTLKTKRIFCRVVLKTQNCKYALISIRVSKQGVNTKNKTI